MKPIQGICPVQVQPPSPAEFITIGAFDKLDESDGQHARRLAGLAGGSESGNSLPCSDPGLGKTQTRTKCLTRLNCVHLQRLPQRRTYSWMSRTVQNNSTQRVTTLSRFDMNLGNYLAARAGF